MKNVKRFKDLKEVDALIDVLINSTLLKELNPTIVNSLTRLLSLKLKLYELKALEEGIARLEKLVEEMRR